jgi:transmembrane 9 superfamily protein 2/4
MFDQKEWKTVFFTATGFSGLGFGVMFVLNLINWGLGASDAVPFTTLVLLIFLWAGISVALCVLGASFAFHNEPITFPVTTGKLLREVPEQRWYYAPPFSLIVPGLVPFIISCLELKFVLENLWLGMVYYVFGFLAIVFVLWAYTCALTAIVMVYYQLAYEDWRWWWRAFLVPSGCGVFPALYCIMYYYTMLDVQSWTGAFIYFGYMGVFVVAYVLTAGCIGLGACLLFTRKIYSSIRID